ncbi:MAG: metal-dependent hydrolase [Polyangiales bacterium]
MTDLKIRKIPFRFDDTTPFQWNPENPEFGLVANAIGMLVISMEKMIVSVVRKVMPRIHDPDAAAEAQAFLRQEALHSRAHQQHLQSLLGRYPGLAETIQEVDSSFRRIEEDNTLEFCVAYIAALEATFPPLFKMILDNHEALLAPGDARVASLFAWHFVEEIEHRSSALVVYDAVVGDPFYRLRVVVPAFTHAAGLFATLIEGFERHVPLEDRLVEAYPLLPSRSWSREITARLPLVGSRFRGRYPTAFGAVPGAELAITVARLLRSQLPYHKPADEPLPRWAETWFDAYERGVDMTTFEGAIPVTPPRP